MAFIIGLLCSARAKSPRLHLWPILLAYLLTTASISLAAFLCFFLADGDVANGLIVVYLLPLLLCLSAPAAFSAAIYFIQRPLLRRTILVATAIAFMASPAFLQTVFIHVHDPGFPELRKQAIARANQEAFERYGVRPFTEKDGTTALYHGLWTWRARHGFGTSDLQATFTYSLHNQVATIQVAQHTGSTFE